MFLVEMFHGTVVAVCESLPLYSPPMLTETEWARNNQLFETERKAARCCNMSTDNDMDLAWRNWALAEQQTRQVLPPWFITKLTRQFFRVVLGLHIHDAQLAEIFHHKPLLQHKPGKVPIAAPDDLFQAPTSQKWAAVIKEKYPEYISPSLDGLRSMRSHHNLTFGTIRSSCHFRAYTVLEGIGASIWEARYTETLDEVARNRFSDSLIAFYKAHCEGSPSQEKDTFSFMILWHSVFVSLYVDYNLLERAIGREGPEEAEACLDMVRKWAISTGAERCILHILLMEKRLEDLRIGVEPAVHVPRALFLGAITVYCSSRFSSGVERRPRRSQCHLDFPEIKMLGTHPTLSLPDTNNSRPGKLSPFDSSTLCRLTDHLQRVGHWEIARKFALILETLIHSDIETHTD